MNNTARFAFAIIILFISNLASAEQFIEDNNYIVHYSAFNSTLITPAVAKAYDLKRSRERGIINISIQRKMPNTANKGVMTKLRGYTGKLGGSEIPLDFKLITEGEAIYYLAEFFIKEGETLNFDINIQPTPNYSGLDLNFKQTFYED